MARIGCAAVVGCIMANWLHRDTPNGRRGIIIGCIMAPIRLVMLINLLVAMMGDTYTRIRDQSEQTWRLEQARILFSIETQMSKAERAQNLGAYQLSINGNLFVQVYELDLSLIHI
eukprot:TRINITY_DN52531_c0_g1_i1.p2 TRINITY_DN52531_c0_g1~~TRINITY_DN52531_c0_g1_i1.p2  ORF type:complete len:116 (+),score=28.76 TRINITY_DN52531_c0_g1_i1:64-411(+)